MKVQKTDCEIHTVFWNGGRSDTGRAEGHQALKRGRDNQTQSEGKGLFLQAGNRRISHFPASVQRVDHRRKLENKHSQFGFLELTVNPGSEDTTIFTELYNGT